jgi:LmbE family N-acetylglucosaminyl deacetylase
MTALSTLVLLAAVFAQTLTARPIVTVYWVFAHPDDETLVAAGAIYDAQQAGYRNVVITVTDGTASAVGPKLGLTPAKLGAAREREEIAALAVLGITPVFLHAQDGAVQENFVENEIAMLARTTPGVVWWRGHGSNDPYAGLAHGNPDHYAITIALETAFRNGVISNLREYTLGQFAGTKPHGACAYLSSKAMAAKQAMRREYGLANRAIGRYGIAVRSVSTYWARTTTRPECYSSSAPIGGILP